MEILRKYGAVPESMLHWEGDSSITSRFRIRLNVQP